MKKDEQPQEEERRHKEPNSAFYLGISGALIGLLLLRHVMKLPKKDNQSDSLQPKTDENAVKVQTGPIPAQPDFEPTPASNPNPNEKWYDRQRARDKIRLSAELITLIGFLLYIGFTYEQMVATQGQLATFKQSLVDDRRAWIFIDGEPKIIVPGENVDHGSLTVDFKNVGKTPAINVQNVTGYTTTIAAIPTKDNSVPKSLTTGYMAPGQSLTTSARVIPKQLVMGLFEGKPIYFYGIFWYDDIFGKQHWSQFAFKVIHDPAMPIGMLEFDPMGIHNSWDGAENIKSQ